MNIKHVSFANLYEALAEVNRIVRRGGFAYVLKSDKNGAVVSMFD